MASELLDFAKDRIRSFMHIGTTDQLYPSFESAAASLGLPLDGPAYGGGEVSWHPGFWSSDLAISCHNTDS